MEHLTSGMGDLARAVRARSDALHNLAYAAQEDIPQDLFRMCRDVGELGRVLARVIEGAPIDRAFGAPGDWGYSHPVGKALAALYASAARGVSASPLKIAPAGHEVPPHHVCGLQGFGALGDTCPACEWWAQRNAGVGGTDAG